MCFVVLFVIIVNVRCCCLCSLLFILMFVKWFWFCSLFCVGLVCVRIVCLLIVVQSCSLFFSLSFVGSSSSLFFVLQFEFRLLFFFFVVELVFMIECFGGRVLCPLLLFFALHFDFGFCFWVCALFLIGIWSLLLFVLCACYRFYNLVLCSSFWICYVFFFFVIDFVV